jgi:nucleoside phosphorylase
MADILGIVTGIAAEASLLRNPAHRVACSGGRPDIAARQARDLIDQGATMLISFGIAGGLDPGLPSGALIVADAVVTDDGRYPADAGWAAALGYSITPADHSITPTLALPRQGGGEGNSDHVRSLLLPAAGGRFPRYATRGASRPGREEDGRRGEPIQPTIRLGAIYGGTAIVFDIAEKARLHAQTGALAVDLESGPVARVAVEAGVPFAALRAIADPAWRGLPPAALLALDEGGRPRLAAVFGSIVKNPVQIPGLIATALATRAALSALLRAGGVLGL